MHETCQCIGGSPADDRRCKNACVLRSLDLLASKAIAIPCRQHPSANGPPNDNALSRHVSHPAAVHAQAEPCAVDRLALPVPLQGVLDAYSSRSGECRAWQGTRTPRLGRTDNGCHNSTFWRPLTGSCRPGAQFRSRSDALPSMRASGLACQHLQRESPRAVARTCQQQSIAERIRP